MSVLRKGLALGLTIAIVGVLMTYIMEFARTGTIKTFIPDHFAGMQVALFLTGIATAYVYDYLDMSL